MNIGSDVGSSFIINKEVNFDCPFDSVLPCLNGADVFVFLTTGSNQQVLKQETYCDDKSCIKHHLGRYKYIFTSACIHAYAIKFTIALKL